MVEKGLMLVTALAPAIGYEQAAALAKEARATGRTIRDLARERTCLSPRATSAGCLTRKLWWGRDPPE